MLRPGDVGTIEGYTFKKSGRLEQPWDQFLEFPMQPLSLASPYRIISLPDKTNSENFRLEPVTGAPLTFELSGVTHLILDHLPELEEEIRLRYWQDNWPREQVIIHEVITAGQLLAGDIHMASLSPLFRCLSLQEATPVHDSRPIGTIGLELDETGEWALGALDPEFNEQPSTANKTTAQ